MKTKQRPKKRILYTLEEANATLPLLRSILRDVTELQAELRERYGRLVRLQKTDGMDSAHRDEVQRMIEDFERAQDRMREYEFELEKLSVELKDYDTGLIDFRHMKEGREVYLCWKLGEPAVAHWHELNAGFSGRQKIIPCCDAVS